MTAYDQYLQDFLYNPINVEEYKVNFLKNHYYPTINKVLECDFNDFQIGTSKNKNLIWFCSKNDDSFEIIYNTSNDKYYKKMKESKQVNEIIINDFSEENDNIKNKKNKKNKKNGYCLLGCLDI